MSAPLVGLGTTAEFASVAAPTVFTTLTGCQSVAFSGDKVSMEKITDMLTPNGVETYISGMKESGECDFKCTYQPGDTSQVALENIRLAGAAVNWKIVYPLSLGSASFSGLVISMTKSFPFDKICTLDVKVKISGAVTIA